MKYIKTLIIIVLHAVVNVAVGQAEGSILDSIDFNDTTMIDGDFMWKSIAEYITAEQNKDADPRNQLYNMILAADNVLSRSSTSYLMYESVYQFLISGFSELGANMVVDYMVRLPYFEFVDADETQIEEMRSIAIQYERVKIGFKAPDIQSNTLDNVEITLSKLKSKNTVVFFWSYSCPHCREMIKELGKLAAKDKDLAVITVNVSGNIKQVKRLLRKSKLDNAYNIFDGKGWDSPIVENYAVDMTPSLFLLDENKIIIAKPFDIDELVNFIEL